jgi:4-amino-4-deoxy-L-arabinose transferase-like glycosyltransferase
MVEERAKRDQRNTTILSYQKMWDRSMAWIDQHPRQILLTLLAVTLILGLIKLRIDPPSPEFNWDNRWWQIALHLVRGEGYIACQPVYFPFCGPTNQVTAMREPLPVLVYALTALLTNESLLSAAALGIFINMGIVVAVFYLAREISSTRTALLAALLWTFYLPPIRLYYSEISGDLFATLAVTAGLFYFLRAQKTNRKSQWLASGFLFGIAILSRSAVLVVAAALTVALVMWAYLRQENLRNSLLRWFSPVFFFAFAWVIVVMPWTIRNTVVFGRPVIGSTLAGYYLYRQNHTLSSDNYLRFVSGGEFLPLLQEMISSKPGMTGNENEAQMNQLYLAEAVQIITAYPLRYLALSAYRFNMLWFNWKVNEVYGIKDSAGDYLMALQNLFLLLGGLIGVRGRMKQVWPLIVSVVVFSLLYMAVMAHLAYIIPVVPALVVLSAIAILKLFSSFTITRRRRPLDPGKVTRS